MNHQSSEAQLDARRRAAIDRCDRVLSHMRRPSIQSRIKQLIEQSGTAHLDGAMDVYGDGVVQVLEQRVAALLGFPAAAFFPSGVMAQQAALRVWAGRTGCRTVALHPLAHPEQREMEALSVLAGLDTVHPTTAPRCPTAAEVCGLPGRFGTLMLELPLRDAGFVLPSWEDLCGTVEAARGRGAAVHFDGARLWECCTHFGRDLASIAGLADSVYVSFYKSLGGLSGAALAGPEDLVAQARVWQRRYGGLLFHQFPAVLAALAGLDHELPRLPRYVAHARLVADAIGGALAELVPGQARVHPCPPHTHQFQVWLPWPAAALEAAGLELAEAQGIALFGKWHEPEGAGTAFTEVTVAASALEWTPAEVRQAVAALVERVQSG